MRLQSSCCLCGCPSIPSLCAWQNNRSWHGRNREAFMFVAFCSSDSNVILNMILNSKWFLKVCILQSNVQSIYVNVMQGLLWSLSLDEIDRTQDCYHLIGGALSTSYYIEDARISQSLMRVLSWQCIYLNVPVLTCCMLERRTICDCVWLILSAFSKQGWGTFLHEFPTTVGVVGERNFITLTWAWMRYLRVVSTSAGANPFIC